MKYFDLIDYYKTNFNLIKQLKLNIFDLEDMYMWEREIYIKLLIDYNEELLNRQREKEFQDNIR